MSILLLLFLIFATGNSSNITIKQIFMVNLELSVIDALAIESLLCMLDSHIKLGDEFKQVFGDKAVIEFIVV